MKKFIQLLLLLSAATLSSQAQVNLISTGAVWKYFDVGSDPGPTWATTGFDDTSWNAGPAELGFGDGGEATTNQAGFITYYYRKSFNVPNASSITNLRARLKRDDGAVVYLNGIEVYRDNMPPGPVNFTTFAASTAADDGSTFIPTNLVASGLLSGNNVLAVEVHQVTNTSSDISFDFELVGNPVPTVTLTSPTNGQTVATTNLTITGTAIPGGQSVSLVELFSGPTKVAQSTNGNFNIAWTTVPGNYSIYAKVTDSSGLIGYSTTNNIVVQAPPASLLIARKSSWKYNNSNTDLGTNFINLAYDDSAWGGPAVAPIGDNNEGGVQQCTTVIDIGATTRVPVVYFRTTFVVGSASAYQGLTLRLQRDDAAAVYLNGNLILNDGVDAPGSFAYVPNHVVSGADEVTYFEFTVPATALVNGTNIVAVEVHQGNATSSDLQFDLEIEGSIDNVAPEVAALEPAAGNTLLALNNITVTFSEDVLGVNASDLLINTEAATNMVKLNPRQYTFYFPQPPTGTVQVVWAVNHGIIDSAPVPNAFAGGSWTYNLDTNVVPIARMIISEFMADNANGIRDEDGSRSDWIELLNTSAVQGVLDGWYLTDDSTNLTKWQFPAGMAPLGPNNYFLVWASAKDKRNPAGPLHTNFKLSKSGGFLALVDPKTNIVSSFNPYPAQTANVSYGRDRVDSTLVGYFTNATPRAQNSTTGSGFVPEPVFSIDTGIYTNASLSLVITSSFGAIRYTTDTSLPTTNSLLYTNPITISANSTIKARVFPPTGSSLFPSAVVGKNYIFLDNTTADFNSNIPLMIISTEGRAIQGEIPPGGTRTKGSMTIIDVSGLRSALRGKPDFQTLGEFEYFGQTSIGFAKKPIRVETQDALGNGLDVSILGMPAGSDYKIRNPYDDKSMLNDYLSAEYFEKMGHYSLRRRFVEAFVDLGGGRLNYASDYYGIMVILENIKVDKDRVDIAKLPNTALTEPTISGGYIFKKDKDSTGDINFSTGGGSGFGGIPLKMHEPKPNDLRVSPVNGALTAAGTNQVNYLRGYLNRMEQAMYSPNWLTLTGTNHYSYYIDQDSFVDFHWLVEFSKQIDGYRISDYFHKDRGGKVTAGPIWDWNLAFGNANYLQGGWTNGWYYEELGDVDHPWLRRMITGSTSATASTGDPDFTQKAADRWSFLRTNIFNGTNVLKRIDELATYLNEAANRDLAYYKTLGTYIWPNPDTTGDGRDVDYVHPLVYNDGTTNSIIGQMKKYMLGRYIWMDSQFVAPPTISATDGQVTNGFSVTITPPPGASVIYTLNGTDPRLPGGAVSSQAISNNGPVTLTINANVRIVARSSRTGSWKNTFSGPAAVSLYTTVPALRITEIMYHPAPPPLGSTNSASDFEYIEVKNIGGAPLNVSGFSLGGGVQFLFPTNVTLTAGQTAVIVADTNAFISRYGSGALILGTFTGSLNNAGDQLVLLGPLQEGVLNFSYEDSWYPATDGLGFSLVTVNENAPTAAWNTAGNWRPSSATGGSPGVVDPAPPARPAILVNELLSNEDLPAGDAIELYNPTASAVSLSGWFLSDNFNLPAKYTIPFGTTIPAHGYLVFYATNSFGVNGTNSFELGARGDQAYLFSGDGVNLTGYAHGLSFGAADKNVTFGRYVNSIGEEHVVPMAINTFGAANSAPLVGPLVISEIQYHPPDIGIAGIGYNDTDGEFIELQNISANPVALYDTSFPTNRWHLRNAVDFDFNTNVVLQPGGYVLVVGFDPAANPGTLNSFRQKNGVGADVPVVGPWIGSLNNAGETIELHKPGVPDTNGTPFITVEAVKYSSVAPWPTGADGFGLSLQRIVPGAYGNDPANWAASAPTPAGNFVGGTAPAITGQPSDRLVVYGNDVLLTAAANGSGPLHYQWRFNGVNLSGATNSILQLLNFQSGQVGTYNILVYNGGGYAIGTNFNLNGRIGLRLTSQPASRLAQTNTSTIFTVGAVGTGTLRYQWRFNGTAILNATNASYALSSIQPANEGAYLCAVSDDFDTLSSVPATLTLIYKPFIAVQPVTVFAVEGQNAVFSAAGGGGTLPLSFRWRTNGFTFTNGIISSTPSNSYLIFTNVSLKYSNNIVTVVITNIAGSAPISVNAKLFVLPDRDHDGLPDQWEIDNGFNPDNPADGAADSDGDGMSNAAEWLAGTDYLNNTSNLRSSMIRSNVASLQFQAISNRTYSVLYRDTVGSGQWQKLSDILATTNNHTEVIFDSRATSNRFYRLVIPSQRP
jgi:hypothetical protein